MANGKVAGEARSEAKGARGAEKSGKSRRGICCAGNWIIDHVKVVSSWPKEETLANILAEDLGTGGSAYNVLVGLARFQLGIPLSGIGLVGDDADGRRILEDCRARGIDASLVRPVPDAPTSYTDVITVKGTGRRTFFHNRGANALFGPEHVLVEELPCRVLNLGYLLLLDRMDEEDPELGTKAARVLASLRRAGILTSIDVVSEHSDRFARIVTPALPHADYCILNEFEAGQTAGIELRPGGRLDVRATEAAARALLERGVHRLVVVHAPEGSFGLPVDGPGIWQPSHALPESFVESTVGAGDAFLAGMLIGIHEEWELSRALRFATSAAATCLRHSTTTGGVGSAEEIGSISETMPYREL